MEEHLRSLAASLGECSRIVSQVLESSNLGSSANVSNEATQVLPANSGRSAGNVSDAIERARSMLQRSQNTGLCSRLNQRERLRATSSPSSSVGDKKAKKPKESEQSKPFEFALVYEEDDEEFVINNNNILLRGFVHLVSTDGEAEVHRKIGDAVRLKYPLVSNNDFVFLRANRRKLSKPVTCEEYAYKQVKLLCGQGAIYITMKRELSCLLSDNEGNSLIGDDDLPGKNIVLSIRTTVYLQEVKAGLHCCA